MRRARALRPASAQHVPAEPDEGHPLHLDGLRHRRAPVRLRLQVEGRHAVRTGRLAAGVRRHGHPAAVDRQRDSRAARTTTSATTRSNGCVPSPPRRRGLLGSGTRRLCISTNPTPRPSHRGRGYWPACDGPSAAAAGLDKHASARFLTRSSAEPGLARGQPRALPCPGGPPRRGARGRRRRGPHPRRRRPWRAPWPATQLRRAAPGAGLRLHRQRRPGRHRGHHPHRRHRADLAVRAVCRDVPRPRRQHRPRHHIGRGRRPLPRRRYSHSAPRSGRRAGPHPRHQRSGRRCEPLRGRHRHRSRRTSRQRALRR